MERGQGGLSSSIWPSLDKFLLSDTLICSIFDVFFDTNPNWLILIKASIPSQTYRGETQSILIKNGKMKKCWALKWWWWPICGGEYTPQRRSKSPIFTASQTTDLSQVTLWRWCWLNHRVGQLTTLFLLIAMQRLFWLNQPSAELLTSLEAD